MALPKGTVEHLLKEAGLKPTDDQIEITMQIYNALDRWLNKVSPSTLKGVEPHYIQPTRRKGGR